MGSPEVAPEGLGARHSAVPPPAVGSESLELRERVRRLNGGLGPTLVSALAGAADSRHARAWAKGTSAPDTKAGQRIHAGYSVWRRVAEVEGEDVAREWFVGANPWLGGDSPVIALRSGRLDQVEIAAIALNEDAFSG